mgnify:CR=1 FL=1
MPKRERENPREVVGGKFAIREVVGKAGESDKFGNTGVVKDILGFFIGCFLIC